MASSFPVRKHYHKTYLFKSISVAKAPQPSNVIPNVITLFNNAFHKCKGRGHS